MIKEGKKSQNEKCKLTFEKIAQKIFKNCDYGYYIIGFVAIFSRFIAGGLTVALYGEWLHEDLLTSVNTVILFTVTLIALRYLKKIYYQTIDTIIQDDKEKQKFFLRKNLISARIWIIIFIGLILNQFMWLYYEWQYIINNPEIVGTLPYRGANQGLIPLLFETFDGLFLYIIFVDLIAILLAICLLPRDVKSYMKIDELHPDKCGGLSIIGRLMLVASATYFIIIAIGTFGRFIDVNYYYLIVFSSIVFGMFIFFLPQYTTHRLIVEEKSQKLRAITKELKDLLSTKGKDKDDQFRMALIRLELFRLREEIERIREYPFDTRILFTFLGVAVFPILTNVVTFFIEEIV